MTGSPPSSHANWIVRDRNRRILLDINPRVFVSSSLLIVLFVAGGLAYLDELAAAVDALQTWIASRAGWFFVLTVNVILAYLLYLFVSRRGAVRLGGEGAEPQFSRPAWLAMLFSAGMGIGLMFYGVAEPVYHLASPPHGAEPGTPGAYEDAIKTTFLHWGLHAWGTYALVGLALAYSAYNRGQPLSIRGIFQPLLGARIHGWAGHTIDTLASVATLFGVATSLGLGAAQVNAGLNHLVGAPVGAPVQLALIAGITGLATASVVLGLHRGIKPLSVFNMVAATVLLAFVLLVGPTIFILKGFVENLGLYLDDLVALAFWNETYVEGGWQAGWTVFYWGWWIAWSPFVGMFIARVSFGRTIREFIGGVLFAATGMTFVWLSVFGGSALYIELAGPGGMVAAVQADMARALFVFLETLPLASGLSVPDALAAAVGLLAVLVIVTFFVTSSDSGSLVIDIITAGGRPNPPVAQRVYWAGLEGVVAAVLLVGGGLTALQTAAISAGLPFAVLVLLMIAAVHRALRADHPAPGASA